MGKHDADHVDSTFANLQLKLLSDSNLGTYNGGVKGQPNNVRLVYLKRYNRKKNEEYILNHLQATLTKLGC